MKFVALFMIEQVHPVGLFTGLHSMPRKAYVHLAVGVEIDGEESSRSGGGDSNG
jgi:hypothetical protein